MYSAVDIANWFVWKNQICKIENQVDNDNYEVYEGLSHLKVQKLLYYAQGISLALNNKKLFKESIVAWEHGPVVKEVYNKLCKNGRNDIPAIFSDKDLKNIEKIDSDLKANNVLNIVYDNFGGYTAWQLRNGTHVVGGPWETTVKKFGMNHKISDDLIKDYFVSKVLKSN